MAPLSWFISFPWCLHDSIYIPHAGSNEYDQISFIVGTLGPPPSSMLCNIRKACKFFTFNPHANQWILKVVFLLFPSSLSLSQCYTSPQTPQQLKAESGVVSKETRKYIFSSLSDLTRLGSHGNSKHRSLVEQLDCLQFVSLVASMLTFDPSSRSSPTQALQCPFITMHHLAAHTSDPRYVCMTIRDGLTPFLFFQCQGLDPVYARLPPLSNHKLLPTAAHSDSTSIIGSALTLLPFSSFCYSCTPSGCTSIFPSHTACLSSPSNFLPPLTCHLPIPSLLSPPTKEVI